MFTIANPRPALKGDAHTNTIEGFFSMMKRGIIGTHHVSQQHLKRYLAEFDFRHNHRIALDVDERRPMDTARWRQE
jgi:hypothetical protein